MILVVNDAQLLLRLGKRSLMVRKDSGKSAKSVETELPWVVDYGGEKTIGVSLLY